MQLFLRSFTRILIRGMDWGLPGFLSGLRIRKNKFVHENKVTRGRHVLRGPHRSISIPYQPQYPRHRPSKPRPKLRLSKTLKILPTSTEGRPGRFLCWMLRSRVHVPSHSHIGIRQPSQSRAQAIGAVCISFLLQSIMTRNPSLGVPGTPLHTTGPLIT